MLDAVVKVNGEKYLDAYPEGPYARSGNGPQGSQ